MSLSQDRTQRELVRRYQRLLQLERATARRTERGARGVATNALGLVDAATDAVPGGRRAKAAAANLPRPR